MLHNSGRFIAVGAAAVALGVVPVAIARTGDAPVAHAAQTSAGDPIRAEVRNGTTAKETEIIGEFDATTSSKGGYVTRQSNTQTGAKAGGGAIYGCRGAAGGGAGGFPPRPRGREPPARRAVEVAA